MKEELAVMCLEPGPLGHEATVLTSIPPSLDLWTIKVISISEKQFLNTYSLRHKTLAIKVPNAEFDLSVSVDEMELQKLTSKIQNEYLS